MIVNILKITLVLISLKSLAGDQCEEKLTILKTRAREMVSFLEKNKTHPEIFNMSSQICQDYLGISAPALEAGKYLVQNCRRGEVDYFSAWNGSEEARSLKTKAVRSDGVVCKKTATAELFNSQKIRTADLVDKTLKVQ